MSLFTDWTEISCLIYQWILCFKYFSSWHTQKNIQSKKKKKKQTSVCLLTEERVTWVNIIVHTAVLILAVRFYRLEVKVENMKFKERRQGHFQSSRFCFDKHVYTFKHACTSLVFTWITCERPETHREDDATQGAGRAHSPRMHLC